jgi:hypothetical protein
MRLLAHAPHSDDRSGSSVDTFTGIGVLPVRRARLSVDVDRTRKSSGSEAAFDRDLTETAGIETGVLRMDDAVTGVTPERITTDGHDSYPGAKRTELGTQVRHRTSRYRNNGLAQDHRGLKGRYRPMRSFKCPRSATRFCRRYDELRNHPRPRSRHNQHVPAARRRVQFLHRSLTVLAILEASTQ